MYAWCYLLLLWRASLARQILGTLLLDEGQGDDLCADARDRLVGETAPQHLHFIAGLQRTIEARERDHAAQRRAIRIAGSPAALQYFQKQNPELAIRQVGRRRRGRVAKLRGVKLRHVLARPFESHQPALRPSRIRLAR